MFFPPTRSGSRKILSLLFPVFSFHSIHLILVSLYSFNRIFLCSQTNSTTAQLLVFLKFFFCSQTNSTTAQLLVFLKLFFSLFTNQQHYCTASGFPQFFLQTFLSKFQHKKFFWPQTISTTVQLLVFLFFTRNFLQGFSIQTFAWSQTTSTTVQLPVFLKSFFFKFKPSALPHSFWFPKHLSQNQQHYHTASGFLKIYLFTNHQHYRTASEFLKIIKSFFYPNQQHYRTASGFLKTFFFHCSQTNSTTAQLLVFHNFSYKHFSVNFNTRSFSDHKPSALPYSFWFSFFLREIFSRGFQYKLLLDHKPPALPYSFRFF